VPQTHLGVVRGKVVGLQIGGLTQIARP